MNKINPFFFEISISTNTQNLWKSGHNNYSNLAKSQMLFYKHEQCIIPDNCNKYEKNYHILHIKNFWKKMVIITPILHTALFYFTYNSSTWYLIMLPNMIKIHTSKWGMVKNESGYVHNPFVIFLLVPILGATSVDQSQLYMWRAN